MNKAKLERAVTDSVVETFHRTAETGGGEWLVEIDGDELALGSERGSGHGVILATLPPGPEPEDENEPWDEEGETKRYALKVTVELTEIG